MNNSLHLGLKYARIFVREHYLFREAKRSSIEENYELREEQILHVHMEATVFIILQIFFATRAVLKIGECSHILPSFS